MADSFDISCWLATHYEADATISQPIKFIDIFYHCEACFEAIGVLPPSKDLVSKLVPSIFKTDKCIVYSGGDQFTAFIGIKPRTSDGNAISIPDSCTARVTLTGELEISCWREYKVNGSHLHLTATFGQQCTSIFCRGMQKKLRFVLPPTQTSVCGMVYIMQQLHICRGYIASDFDTNESVYEEWLDITNGGMPERRFRAPHCKNLLSFYSKVDHCDVCLKKAKRTMKREASKAPNNEPTPAKQAYVDDNTIEESREGNAEDRINQLIGEGGPEKFKLLLREQLKNSRTDLDKRQRKWDPEFISFCLNIFVKSPRIYRDLRNSEMLVLPSESLLRMYKNCVKQKPGLCHENLIWMKKESERQNVSTFGKRGGLVIDEMSIQDDLQIVRKGDAWCIVGGVDMGETNNLLSVINNKGRKVELATHCLQFIFHGHNGFRWPVAYYGSNPATTHQIFINFWECVDALDEHGFVTDYVMLDGASTNRAFMNMLLNDDPRASKYTTRDIYNLDHDIFVIQDIKHVIKRIRNNIEASKQVNASKPGRYLVIDNKPVIWEHFQEAYSFNQLSGLRIHRHLTKDHVELTSASKMRNRLAEQVLDKDMLFLMKSFQATLSDPERLSATVRLLEHSAILVDIFRDTRSVSDPMDQRFDQLEAVLKFFNDWELNITKSIKYTPAKNLLPQETRDDINSTIVGFRSLCRALLRGGDSLTPAYINSDLVENHFCQQRGNCNGLNTNPTLAQYGPSNTSICLSQSAISAKANSSTKPLNFKASTPCPLNKKR